MLLVSWVSMGNTERHFCEWTPSTVWSEEGPFKEGKQEVVAVVKE